MKTLNPIRFAGLFLGSLLLLALFARADETDSLIEEQAATEVPMTLESPAPATPESPAPARKQYIDPFSGMPLPEYSYTNSLPVPTRWRTLTVDPFSGTPLPAIVAPVTPKPVVVPESEPEFIPPIWVELPPGAYVARSSTRPIPSAIRIAPRLWEMVFSETDRWDFPPGAVLRRIAGTDPVRAK
jgi:hypothetical protein